MGAIAMTMTRTTRAIERRALPTEMHFTLLDTDIDNLQAGLEIGFEGMKEELTELRRTHQWLVKAAFGVMASLFTTSLLLFVNLYHK